MTAARKAQSRSRAPRRIVVGMSGASGTPYARMLLAALARAGVETHVTISEAFFDVARAEMGEGLNPGKVDLAAWCGEKGDFHYYAIGNVAAPAASGSFRTMGMIVAPCSVATLGSIANGSGRTLIDRAAEVAIKEGRRLTLLLRESPLSAIALENALKLARLGVFIVPTSPGFYVQPQTIDDIVAYTVSRTLDLYDIGHDLSRRWGEA